jgi:hypothetical protein
MRQQLIGIDGVLKDTINQAPRACAKARDSE